VLSELFSLSSTKFKYLPFQLTFLNPVFPASQCPPLSDVEHATANLLAGRGLNYGTVIRYECDQGYERTGLPVVICQSDGSWSSELPTCSRKQCFVFPEIENGYIIDKTREYFYGDQVSML